MSVVLWARSAPEYVLSFDLLVPIFVVFTCVGDAVFGVGCWYTTRFLSYSGETTFSIAGSILTRAIYPWYDIGAAPFSCQPPRFRSSTPHPKLTLRKCFGLNPMAHGLGAIKCCCTRQMGYRVVSQLSSSASQKFVGQKVVRVDLSIGRLDVLKGALG